MIVRKMQDRLRARFNFSIAELDHHDLWQRCQLGAVTIGANRKKLEEVANHFVRESERILGDDLIDVGIEFID